MALPRAQALAVAKVADLGAVLQPEGRALHRWQQLQLLLLLLLAVRGRLAASCRRVQGARGCARQQAAVHAVAAPGKRPRQPQHRRVGLLLLALLQRLQPVHDSRSGSSGDGHVHSAACGCKRLLVLLPACAVTTSKGQQRLLKRAVWLLRLVLPKVCQRLQVHRLQCRHHAVPACGRVIAQPALRDGHGAPGHAEDVDGHRGR
jgi:hypothetical protein